MGVRLPAFLLIDYGPGISERAEVRQRPEQRQESTQRIHVAEFHEQAYENGGPNLRQYRE
jgi:hypothetical protein